MTSPCSYEDMPTKSFIGMLLSFIRFAAVFTAGDGIVGSVGVGAGAGAGAGSGAGAGVGAGGV